MASVRIYLKERVNSDGRSTVFLQLSHQGIKQRFSTKIKVPKKMWEEKSRRVKSAYPFSYDLNREIFDIEKSVSEVLHELRDNFNIDVAKVKIEDILAKHEAPKEKTFFGYLEDFKHDSKTKRAKLTIAKYHSLGKLLEEFSIYFRWPLTFDGMTKEFGERFLEFLLRDKKQLNNTAEKYISCLRTFLAWIEGQGIRVNIDYRKYRGKKHNIEPIYLTEDELFKLYRGNFSKESYNKVRDIFCLACWTGLRFSDVVKISKANIKGDAIHINMQKTSEEVVVPLNQYSRAILEKYDYQLPKISNQKANDYIKAICKEAEFNQPEKIVQFRGVERIETTMPKCELISFHDARRTFIILLLVKGVHQRVVMQMSGHKTYSSFEKYVRIADNVTKNAMQMAWG